MSKPSRRLSLADWARYRGALGRGRAPKVRRTQARRLGRACVEGTAVHIHFDLMWLMHRVLLPCNIKRVQSVTGMVMRVFTAWPHDGAAPALERLLPIKSIELVADRPGFRGYVAAGPANGGYVFVTFWSDEEAVRVFAGEHWQESVLPDGYAELLQDHRVEHLPVLGMSGLPF